jgi:hypothetical protein
MNANLIAGVAAAGGAAVGWAYGELLPNLPPRPWTILEVTGLIAVILLPSIILAELREPLFDITVPGGRLQVSTGRAALVFVLEFLLTATLVGGAAGWLIGRSGQAAMATAVAGFIYALGPGQNIPLVGGTPGVAKELAMKGCLDASCNSMGVPYLESTKSCISLAVFSGCPNHGT